MPAGRSARGFSLLELTVAMTIIGILAAVLLSRLAYYQEVAEKVAMETTVRLIKTGLQIRLAELIITRRQSLAPQLEVEDPVQWMERKPANYGGVFHDYPSPGTWYFDDQEHQLVYVVNTGSRLELGGQKGVKLVRFRARLLRDRVKMAGGPIESVTGVALAPVIPYRWP